MSIIKKRLHSWLKITCSINEKTFTKSWILKYWVWNCYDCTSIFTTCIVKIFLNLRKQSSSTTCGKILIEYSHSFWAFPISFSLNIDQAFVIIDEVLKDTVSNIQLRSLISNWLVLCKSIQIKKRSLSVKISFTRWIRFEEKFISKFTRTG